MRESRIILENVETYYHVSNELRQDLKALTQEEQKNLESFIFASAECCAIEVIAYTVYSLGYDMLIRIPKPYRVRDKDLEELIKKHFNNQIWNNYVKLKLNSDKENLSKQKKMHRARLFSLQEFVRFYAQRFSRFYNSEHDQKGPVWRQRFRSFPVINDSDLLKDVIGYVHTRPATRENKIKDPSSYTLSSWSKVISGNQKWRKIYNHIAEEKDWRKSKNSFLTSIDLMEGRLVRPYYGDINEKLVEKYRNKNKMTKEKIEERKKNWKRMYGRLKRYVEKNGDFLFPRNSEKHRDLVYWVRMQKNYYRKNKISTEHKVLLEKIKFPFDTKTSILKQSDKNRKVSAIWLKKYNLLKKYKKEHGDISPPYKDNEVYSFVNYQRTMKKKKKLTMDQLTMLDDLNFPWSTKRKKH
ncbi:MAG: hypothetical protein GY714_31165 [Desulfobacterales bacterium]|nr:hypothetical protein [Desulfobacterales bacterium]MCP4162014.1 hypothetical protein [Deltaproteobacteria bacterium]